MASSFAERLALASMGSPSGVPTTDPSTTATTGPKRVWGLFGSTKAKTATDPVVPAATLSTAAVAPTAIEQLAINLKCTTWIRFKSLFVTLKPEDQAKLDFYKTSQKVVAAFKACEKFVKKGFDKTDNNAREVYQIKLAKLHTASKDAYNDLLTIAISNTTNRSDAALFAAQSVAQQLSMENPELIRTLAMYSAESAVLGADGKVNQAKMVAYLENFPANLAKIQANLPIITGLATEAMIQALATAPGVEGMIKATVSECRAKLDAAIVRVAQPDEVDAMQAHFGTEVSKLLNGTAPITGEALDAITYKGISLKGFLEADDTRYFERIRACVQQLKALHDAGVGIAGEIASTTAENRRLETALTQPVDYAIEDLIEFVDGREGQVAGRPAVPLKATDPDRVLLDAAVGGTGFSAQRQELADLERQIATQRDALAPAIVLATRAETDALAGRTAELAELTTRINGDAATGVEGLLPEQTRLEAVVANTKKYMSSKEGKAAATATAAITDTLQAVRKGTATTQDVAEAYRGAGSAIGQFTQQIVNAEAASQRLVEVKQQLTAAQQQLPIAQKAVADADRALQAKRTEETATRNVAILALEQQVAVIQAAKYPLTGRQLLQFKLVPGAGKMGDALRTVRDNVARINHNETVALPALQAQADSNLEAYQAVIQKAGFDKADNLVTFDGTTLVAQVLGVHIFSGATTDDMTDVLTDVLRQEDTERMMQAVKIGQDMLMIVNQNGIEHLAATLAATKDAQAIAILADMRKQGTMETALKTTSDQEGRDYSVRVVTVAGRTFLARVDGEADSSDALSSVSSQRSDEDEAEFIDEVRAASQEDDNHSEGSFGSGISSSSSTGAPVVKPLPTPPAKNPAAATSSRIGTALNYLNPFSYLGSKAAPVDQAVVADERDDMSDTASNDGYESEEVDLRD